MVMEHVKAVRRLKERIKNFNLLYCKLQAHPESNNLFYCCQVADVDLYEDILINQTRNAASITLKSLRRSSGSFIERVEKQTSLSVVKKVSSMEVLNTGISREKLIRWRYAHHHEKIFELLLEAIQKECHTINQEFLLEKMHSISECDSLLIENETESHKFTPSDLHDSIPDTKLTRSLINKRATPKARKKLNSDEDEMEIAPYMPARVFYPPGHFACRIVAHHWFYIHPRLHMEMRGAGCSLVMGYDALRQGIEQFAVRNRCNLYVCCEDNKRNIFYMQLFASEEIIKIMIENFQNNVLLTIHGIHEPAVVIQSIVDAMQKRLELKVLEELTNILYKNPRTRLTTTDVEV
ncbi:unnamed protein product [Onchocerca flexuosa]|uniref:ACT domain-containing protein n=1 Tax=Onchocerca flexuosa TaxID=387005 RepID=A0A183H5B8_9BILA|nr:unnamed protein product [Onchocerca flexuosa]